MVFPWFPNDFPIVWDASEMTPGGRGSAALARLALRGMLSAVGALDGGRWTGETKGAFEGKKYGISYTYMIYIYIYIDIYIYISYCIIYIYMCIYIYINRILYCTYINGLIYSIYIYMYMCIYILIDKV